jgi:DNA-binding PadR family transcriptional regulator
MLACAGQARTLTRPSYCSDLSIVTAASLRERSLGAFDLPEGTVYPALHRLERDGLINSEWDARAPRRRRVYQLTTSGAKSTAAKRQDWREFARGMQVILGHGATQEFG